MNTNEELAREIAAKLGGFQEAFDGAMAMAKIKDEQIKRILSALSEQSSNPRVMYDEDDLWNNAKSLESDMSHVVSDNFWGIV